MCLTLAAGRAAAATRLWDELGLLAVLLPELGVGETLGAGAVGDRPDRSATLSLVERLDDMMERLPEWFPETGGLLAARLAEPIDGAVTRPVALSLAGLTYGLTAQEVRAVASRLKLSSAMGSLLLAVARSSMVTATETRGAGGTAGTLTELLPAGVTVNRSAVLFLWEAAPWEPEAIMMAAAAGDGPGPATQPARRLMCLHVRRATGETPSVPLDGDRLMRELGLGEGPLLGRALREARLAWEAGEARTVDEALAVARRVVAGS
jgi:hypothetical protein